MDAWDQFQDAPEQPQVGSDPWSQFQDAEQSQPVDNRGTFAQPEQAYSPTDGMSVVDRIRAGIGQGFANFGRGVRQAALSAGAYGAESQGDITPQGRQNVIQSEQANISEARRLDAPLLATTGGKVGSFIGNVATLLPTAAIPGANTVTGAGLIGASTGLLQPSTSTKETLTNTALGGALGAGSQYLSQKAASWIGNKLATRQASAQSNEAANSVRDATLKEARQAGYVAPPSTSNPTATNKALESVAGKYATEAEASIKNQRVTNELVKKELGLPKDAQLTEQVLNGVRSKAGQVYKAVKSSGEIIPDQEYLNDVVGLVSGMDDIAKAFPGAKSQSAEQITQLADSLMQDKFPASTAVEYVKNLRKQSSSNFKAVYAGGGDPEKLALAKAQWEAAGTLEDMIGRHLSASGKPDLASQFEKARTLIAKTYSAESALNPGTGNIIARNLATQLKKGKPLSGGFETIAKFAQSFPKATMEPTSSKGVSALSAVLGGGGVLTGHPELLAIAPARMLVRNSLLSQVGQNALAMPTYAPNALGTAALKTTNQLSKYAVPIALSVQASQQ